MSFYTKYELLDLTRDEGLKTFSARQLSSGQKVSVHILGSLDPSSIAAVLDDVHHLPPDKQNVLIETGEHEGTPYIVTNEWPAALSFRAWVAGASVRAKPPGPVDRFSGAGTWRVPTSEFRGKADPRISPSPGTSEAAELESFTRMFGVPMPEQPPLPPTPEPHEPEAPEPPKHASGPGEFTRMFAAGSAADPPRVQQPPGHSEGTATRTIQIPVFARASEAQPAQPPATADKEPGEFTKMFQAKTPQPPPAEPPAVPPAKQSPGEFTQMFQAAAPRSTAAVPAAVPPPPAPAAAPPVSTAQPGSFTQMFQQSAPPAKPASSGPGEFTRIFQQPAAPVSNAPSAAPQPPPPPKQPFDAMFEPPLPQGSGMFPAVPPPVSSGPATPAPHTPAEKDPGEFTRLFNPPPTPQSATPHPAYNDPFSQAKPPSSRPEGPGEFTRMFGPASSTAKPPAGMEPLSSPSWQQPAWTPPPPQSTQPPPVSQGAAPWQAPAAPQSYGTPFGSPGAPSATGAFHSPPPQPAAGSSPPVQQGPSEYTRMFSPPAASPQPSAPPASAVTAPPVRSSKPNYLPLILIGAGFIIVLVLLVAFFVRK